MNEGDVVAAQKNATEGLDLRLGESSARGKRTTRGMQRQNTDLFSARVDFLGLVQSDVHELRARQHTRRQSTQRAADAALGGGHLIKTENDAFKPHLEKNERMSMIRSGG